MAAIPPEPADVDGLLARVRAHHPLVLVETVEEERLRTVLAYVCDRTGLPFFVWDRAGTQ
ncbi:MAG: hypothetical protein AAF411_08635 [Myxococcota bacterium]